MGGTMNRRDSVSLVPDLGLESAQMWIQLGLTLEQRMRELGVAGARVQVK